MSTALKNSSGEYITIQSGESCNLTGTLKSTEGETVSSVSSLTITLYDKASGTIINSRNSQNVNNVNGGTFSAGVYTIER